MQRGTTARLVGTALIIAIGLAFMLRHVRAPAATNTAPAAIPVTLVEAQKQDVPETAASIGTVQAFNSVAIKSRVDGPIMQVLFTEGDMVKAGQPLFKIDPTIYQAANDVAAAKQQQDQAMLANAERDLDRDTHVGPLAVTQQAIDTQRALVAQDTAIVKSDAAALESAAANLRFTDIVAPIAGRTGARMVDVGNFIQASAATTLVTITQTKPIFVSFTAPQGLLDQIQTGQRKAPLEVQALSADGKTVLATGKLSLIDNQINIATGTVLLKAQFANTDERLWPGEFVSTRLVLGERKDVVTVPQTALLQGPNGSIAYVVDDSLTAHRRVVDVTTTENGLAVIAKGLAAGDHVVADGQYRLADNAKVRVVTPNATASNE